MTLIQYGTADRLCCNAEPTYRSVFFHCNLNVWEKYKVCVGVGEQLEVNVQGLEFSLRERKKGNTVDRKQEWETEKKSSNTTGQCSVICHCSRVWGDIPVGLTVWHGQGPSQSWKDTASAHTAQIRPDVLDANRPTDTHCLPAQEYCHSWLSSALPGSWCIGNDYLDVNWKLALAAVTGFWVTTQEKVDDIWLTFNKFLFLM